MKETFGLRRSGTVKAVERDNHIPILVVIRDEVTVRDSLIKLLMLIIIIVLAVRWPKWCGAFVV